MRTFILTGLRNRDPILGGFYQLIHQAQIEIADNPNLILQVYKAWAGENDCVLVAELTRDGVRFIENGRQQTISSLLKD